MPVVIQTESAMAALRDAQARADVPYRAHGRQAPMPVHGEPVGDYQKRLVHGLQGHSETWKGMNLTTARPDMMAVVERAVYADAVAAAHDPKNVPRGTLREIRTPDGSGRVVSEFVGHPDDCFAPFKVPAQRVRISRNGHGG